MRCRILTILAVAASLPAAVASAASSSGPNRITTLLPLANGIVLFYIETPRSTTNIPTCGTGEPSRWALRANTLNGQSQLFVLLKAYSMGKRITIYGLSGDSCSARADTETVDYFVTEN